MEIDWKNAPDIARRPKFIEDEEGLPRDIAEVYSDKADPYYVAAPKLYPRDVILSDEQEED